ncbi:unnamed protein product, partial [marine sediment metagenome]
KFKKTNVPAQDELKGGVESGIPNQAQTEGNIAGGMGELSGPVTLIRQYIKSTSFTNHFNPQKGFQITDKPEVGLNVNYAINKIDDTRYEVSLKLGANCSFKGEKLYDVDLVYGGIFTFQEGLEERNQRLLLLVECPHLLFPAARQVLSNLIIEGGFPPLTMRPINFSQVLRRELERRKGSGENVSEKETEAVQ